MTLAQVDSFLSYCEGLSSLTGNLKNYEKFKIGKAYLAKNTFLCVSSFSSGIVLKYSRALSVLSCMLWFKMFKTYVMV
jgi:hypothetical protein